MEGLIVVIFVVWAIISSVSKQQKKAQKTSERQSAAQQTVQIPQRAPAAPQPTLERFTKAKKKPSQQMSQQRPLTEGEGSLGKYIPMQSREGLSNYKPLQHRLDTSGRHTEYTGSLGGSSGEGRDTCDPTLGHDREGAYQLGGLRADEAGGQPELKLGFDSPALLQGIVMSEILTRPSQRKWGRR